MTLTGKGHSLHLFCQKNKREKETNGGSRITNRKWSDGLGLTGNDDSRTRLSRLLFIMGMQINVWF